MAAITVGTFTELRNAITDATSTEIYLSDDIVFASGGIVVPRTKGDITIDGGGIYSITDYNSTAASNTIHFNNVSGADVTFTIQNLNWLGMNYYGMLYTPESANGSNITLVIKNISYTGPQAVHNRYGQTRVTDSTFTLTRTGVSVTNEFCETNRLYISGVVTVESDTTLHSVIWLTSPSAELEVGEGAFFSVTSTNNYIFYSDYTPYPTMTFGANSVTNLVSQSGTFLNNSTGAHIPSSVTIGEGASVNISQLNRNAYALLKCRDTLTMEEGSSLTLVQQASGTSPLILLGARATLNFNNPKSVLLYNNGGAVFSFSTGSAGSPNTINITTELLNLWTAATTPYSDAGGFDDIPSHALSKEGYADITATINTSTTTTTAVSSNIMEGDTGYPMTTANFNVVTARVISMGRLNLTGGPLTDLSAAITGTTEPAANIRAMFDAVTLTGNADSNGQISLPVSPKIAAGTWVNLASNWRFLIKQIRLLTQGSVSITYLSDLVFKTFAAPYGRDTIYRQDSGWFLTVTDTRLTQSPDWYLYVMIPAPLTNSQGDTLDDTLTLVEGSGSAIVTETPILVRRGEWSAPTPKDTHITWAEIEGFLLKIVPNYSYNAGRYATTMRWEITDN